MSGKSRSRISFVFLLLCATALLIIVPGAAAQETYSVELIGVVEALSLNTVTVNQQSVNISRAEINTALTVGALVEVEGTLGSDGSITAREVNAARPGVVAGEAELIGLLAGIRDTTLIVSGQIIDITGAEVRGVPEIGQWLRIHASVTGPNTWQAREVEVMTDDDTPRATTGDEFEITGTLERIDGSTVVVAGQSIDISSAEINDPLLIGTRVKVHVIAAAGVLTAREIELADPDDDDDDSENSNANANSNSNSNSNDNSNGNFNTNGNDNTRFVAAVTLEQAISEVRRVYPNAQIRRIELRTRFGDTLVWEIEIDGGIALIIDAQSGILLTIDRPGSGDNTNSNSNDNEDDDDSNENGNSNSNSNDNDDNGNDNEDGDNDNEDDDREDDHNDNGDDDGEDDDNDND